MGHPDEAAAIVKALQRHAAIVVQKSLAEGFGLTVAEAMWKSHTIVANAVGGIVDQVVDGEHGLLIDDQVVDGEHGLLIDDPRDLAAFDVGVEKLFESLAERG